MGIISGAQRYNFSVLVRARNHFNLLVLEAVLFYFIKVRSPVLCQQKEFVNVQYLM